MKSLSSLERNVLECINGKKLSFHEVQYQSGLNESICFNIIQALLIRGLLKCESGKYRINEELSPVILDEVNGMNAKDAEYLELVESVIYNKFGRNFSLKKIALLPEDEKLFSAMMCNVESFLKEAHERAEKTIPMKERKVVFWGMGEVQRMLGLIATGRQV
jgi:hypothetical protein